MKYKLLRMAELLEEVTSLCDVCVMSGYCIQSIDNDPYKYSELSFCSCWEEAKE